MQNNKSPFNMSMLKQIYEAKREITPGRVET